MEKIKQLETHREMEVSYIDYAMSVIVGRALPDVRDGLKPVHRRILYGMSELGITPDKPHKKSARIVGEVMGKYHPHGDSSIYDAMVRLAQDFSTRYLLVDGHGNFGSVDGDGAAAMRYTEARMSPFALEMLRDIKKDSVDFVPNFDEEEKEPVVLPARFPNLLVNGSNGIAVGMATSIPPHNLAEVIDGCVLMIDGEPTIDELCKVIKGPDFPTGAQILGRKEIKKAYATGNGKITVRGVATIEEGNRGKHNIIITEIPFQVNKAKLLEKIATLVSEKRIDGVSAIRDESNRKGMRIVIEVKRDANPNIVLNRLYKNTPLQDTFSINMLALSNGQPKVFNLKDILKEYLEHQKEVVTRRTIFDLENAEKRKHILEGYLIALYDIDEIIEIIKSSKDNAKERLIKKYDFSYVQARAILELKLARIQKLEIEKIQNEFKELEKTIKYYKSLLDSEKKLMGVVKEELLEIKDKWGDKRRTTIKKAEEEIEEIDLVENKEVVITITNQGYVKRVPAEVYRTQVKGGKGVQGAATRSEDFITEIITASTHDTIMFFTNIGKMYAVKVYEIPEGTRTARGTAAINFLPLVPREKISTVMKRTTEMDGYLLSVSKNGMVKKTAMSDYNTNKRGIVAVKIKSDDEIITIKEATKNSKIILVTKQGKSIAFSEEEIRPMGRVSAGVKGIDLDKDDEVVAAEVVKPKDMLTVVTSKGYAKKTPVGEYKIQQRGGKGLATYDKSKFSKTGTIAGALVVNDDDEIFLINADGIIIKIKCSEINTSGRKTSGGKIMNTNVDLVAIAKVNE